MEDKIIGRNPVMEAIRANREIEKIFIKKGGAEGSIVSIIKKAKEKNVCIELNEHTLVKSSKSYDFCRKIALACKKHGTKVVINSDAHFCTEVGVYEKVPAMLEEIEFPKELIMNTNASRFIKYLEEKRNKKYNF